MSNTDFLDLLDTVKAEEATVQRMFNATDGRGVRHRGQSDARYERALLEAAKLYSGVLAGTTPMYRLREAMSTSDFPLLFGDIIDRQMLGAYEEWPSIWPKIARRGSRRDFRKAKLFTLDGADGVLDPVGQGAPYPEAPLNDGDYEYAVGKFGRALSILWEAIINDDLQALRDLPSRLAKAARMTEERMCTELYCSGSGPDSTFYTSGHKNVGTGVLNADNLSVGITAMYSQTDPQGNPIFPGEVRLVVPPQLRTTANNLLHATQIITAPGATSGQQVLTENWVPNDVAEAVVNPWLPIIDTTHGATSWYLFADPGIGRPALEVGFLAGHEAPELFMKSPNATRVGGGVAAAEDGDFDTDSLGYKVRHVLGATKLDFRASYASNGTV